MLHPTKTLTARVDTHAEEKSSICKTLLRLSTSHHESSAIAAGRPIILAQKICSEANIVSLIILCDTGTRRPCLPSTLTNDSERRDSGSGPSQLQVELGEVSAYY